MVVKARKGEIFNTIILQYFSDDNNNDKMMASFAIVGGNQLQWRLRVLTCWVPYHKFIM